MKALYRNGKLSFSFVQKRDCGTTAEPLLCTGDYKLQFVWLYPLGGTMNTVVGFLTRKMGDLER